MYVTINSHAQVVEREELLHLKELKNLRVLSLNQNPIDVRCMYLCRTLTNIYISYYYLCYKALLHNPRNDLSGDYNHDLKYCFLCRLYQSIDRTQCLTYHFSRDWMASLSALKKRSEDNHTFSC